ncbi:unnamed protein product [Musa textilis]
MGRAALVRAIPSEDALRPPWSSLGMTDREERRGGASVVSHEDSCFCVYPKGSLTMIPRRNKERRSSILYVSSYLLCFLGFDFKIPFHFIRQFVSFIYSM